MRSPIGEISGLWFRPDNNPDVANSALREYAHLVRALCEKEEKVFALKILDDFLATLGTQEARDVQ